MTGKERAEKLKKLAFRGGVLGNSPIYLLGSRGDGRGGYEDVRYRVRWTHKRFADVCADTGNVLYYQYPKKGIERKGDDLSDLNDMVDERILEKENTPLVDIADPSVNESCPDPLADNDE